MNKEIEIEVVQSPLSSTPAATCFWRRGRKMRWLLIAKARHNRVCEAAYSDDLGANWKVVQIGNTPGEGPMIGGSLSPITSQIIYFISNRKHLYLSCDGGETWRLEKEISDG